MSPGFHRPAEAGSHTPCWRRLQAAAVLAVAVCAAVGLRARDEVRALWVVRSSLTSPQAIDTMVAAAQQSGFNTLLLQVRGLGDSYFLNGIEPRPLALASQPAFDPLADAIAKAHARGLAVHAWIDVDLVAGTDIPLDRQHIAHRHPEWLMVPRAIAADLATLDPAGPEYLGRLTRFARAKAPELDGLYLSPATAASVDYTTSVVRDIVQRYSVDGVHLDYLRYPSADFEYGRETLSAFRRATGIADPDAAPDRWRAFRMDRLTALLTELRRAIKAARPSATVSVAVAPEPRLASTEYLQDIARWLSGDLMDVVCATPYTSDGATFVSQLAAAQAEAGGHALWAGIGANQLSTEQTLDNIQAARRLGIGGIILFSYDGLIAPARGSGYLSQLGKAAFGAQF